MGNLDGEFSSACGSSAVDNRNQKNGTGCHDAKREGKSGCD